MDRQYPPARRLLEEAVARAPNDPAPRLELGLMLMQQGDLPAARSELATATRLDPYHRGANNQLQLVEALLNGYETVETEHFLIRFRPGIDEALARDMPGPLEEMYDELTAVFDHKPTQRTQIDLMPDKSHFAVRITGMPHFITIAAATGDVIALTPPRRGADQANPFNWVNVLRHEYVHVVTLSQTRNRVPHWFTEACAVSQETTGRTWDTCRLLAHALSPAPRKRRAVRLRPDQLGLRPPQAAQRPCAGVRAVRLDAAVHRRTLEPPGDRRPAGAVPQRRVRRRGPATPYWAWTTGPSSKTSARGPPFRSTSWGLGPRETSDRAKRC